MSLEEDLEAGMDFGDDLLAAANTGSGAGLVSGANDLEQLEKDSMGLGDLENLEAEVADMDPEDKKRKMFMQKQTEKVEKEHEKKVK